MNDTDRPTCAQPCDAVYVKLEDADPKDVVEIRCTSLGALGQGVVPLVVMADPTLSIEAKGIYALLCSIYAAEKGGWTVGQMLAGLQVGENRFYKHRRMLIEHGLIEVHQPSIYERAVYEIKDGSEFYGDLSAPGMTLAKAIDTAVKTADEQGVATPDTVDSAEEQLASDEPPEQTWTFDLADDAAPGAPHADPPEAADPLERDYVPAPPRKAAKRPASRIGIHAYDDEVVSLLTRAITCNDSAAKVRWAYLRLIDRGWTPEDIAASYEAYCVDHMLSHRTPAGAMKLVTFLRGGNGVRFWALKALDPDNPMPTTFAQAAQARTQKRKPARNEKARSGFTPPTLEEVQAYVAERNLAVDPVAFFSYYDGNGWVSSSGIPVSSWRSTIASWSNRAERQRAKSLPSIPERSEVEAYCKQEKLSLDIDGFMSYWDSRGWMFNANSPVKDWAAAARHYAAMDAKRAASRKQSQQEAATEAEPARRFSGPDARNAERMYAKLNAEQRREFDETAVAYKYGTRQARLVDGKLIYEDEGGAS